MQKVILASNNAGKMAEILPFWKNLASELVPQSFFKIETIAETGQTFIENALLKARHASRLSGLPALADDSGLSVDYLQGAPGLFSARFAGKNASNTANIEKLLALLHGVPMEKRSAHFYCVMVYLHHAEDPIPIIAEGKWTGKILLKPRGEQGFGYDPIFFDEKLQCSAAELTADIKNKISHRGQALTRLVAKLRS